MIRCATAALTPIVLMALALPAAAQAPRNFPANALRGELQVMQPPEVLINGRPARLAPGVRIRGENNLLVMSATLVDRRTLVHYTVDDHGLVKDVWLLTPAEQARRPWPQSAAEAQRWRFDPLGQTWSRP
jgi:hypothetical protein